MDIKKFDEDEELQKKLEKSRAWEKKHKRVKCNCGHYMKDHYGAGWCDKCGCTWYWPNDRYILREQKKKENLLR